MESKNQKVTDKRQAVSMSCLCIGSICSAFGKDSYIFWLAILFYLVALVLCVVVLVEEFKKSRKH